MGMLVLALACLAVQRDVLRRREDSLVLGSGLHLASDFNYPHIFKEGIAGQTEAKEGFLGLVCCYTTIVLSKRTM